VSRGRLTALLREQGISLRTKADAVRLGAISRRSEIDTESTIAAYTGGASAEAIARSMGVHERVVRRALQEGGVPLRTRSEANTLRMTQASEDERRKITEAARAKARANGTLWTPEVVSKAMKTRARTNQVRGSMVGSFEEDMRKLLVNQGSGPIPQLAVGTYNLDLALAPVAVEVHVCASNPMTNARLRQRSEKLLDAGWTSLYIWITNSFPLLPRAAEYAITFREAIERSEAPRREHRVIRGTGELVASYRRDPDNGAFVPTSVGPAYRTRRNHPS